MTFDRVLRLPAVGRGGGPNPDGDDSPQLKNLLVGATGGMGAVKVRTRHPDGSVTDAATGELISGPDPDWVADQEWRTGRRK